MIDNDVRVSIFDVGNPGDCPRTISIVEEGGNLYLWIGFYMAEYFEKFAYDPVANTLTSTGDSIYVAPYNGYTAVIDGNGILWGVSRNASPYPSPSGTPGVFYFDTNDLGAGVTALLYDLPGKSGENPYAIVLKSDGTVWVSDGSNWGTNQARYFAVYTWGTPVTVEYVNTGVNSQAMRGFMEDGDGNIWATSIDGQVIKLTWTGAAWSGATMLSGLGELTGLGADAFGWFWVIRYSTDQMTRFDPTLADPIPQDVSVPLGDGPYAYGNFVQTAPPTYDICGYKYADWDDCYIALPSWNITLERVSWNATLDEWVADPGFAPLTATTDGDGKYCFTDLEAGNYSVSEALKPGWEQLSPDEDDGWVHIVELPGGATDPADPDTFYNFVNAPEKWCGDQTAWAADPHPGDTTFSNANNWATYVGYTKGSGNETDPVAYPLYAGQHYLAGMLYVWDDGDTLYVQYTSEIPEAILEHCLDEGGKVYEVEGYCEGSWTGLLEYHLHVADDEDGIPRTTTGGRGKGKNGSPTLSNPIPGHFEYKDYFDPAAPYTEWFAVDIGDLDNSFVIAAHAVMQWCGYDCDAVAEIKAAVDLTGDWELVFDWYGTPFTWDMTITDHDSDGNLLGAVNSFGLTGSCDYPLISLEVDASGIGLTVWLEGTVSCTSNMTGTAEFSTGETDIPWTATRVTP
jgi:hypothetical protein